MKNIDAVTVIHSDGIKESFFFNGEIAITEDRFNKVLPTVEEFIKSVLMPLAKEKKGLDNKTIVKAIHESMDLEGADLLCASAMVAQPAINNPIKALVTLKGIDKNSEDGKEDIPWSQSIQITTEGDGFTSQELPDHTEEEIKELNTILMFFLVGLVESSLEMVE